MHQKLEKHFSEHMPDFGIHGHIYTYINEHEYTVPDVVLSAAATVTSLTSPPPKTPLCGADLVTTGSCPPSDEVVDGWSGSFIHRHVYSTNMDS